MHPGASSRQSMYYQHLAVIPTRHWDYCSPVLLTIFLTPLPYCQLYLKNSRALSKLTGPHKKTATGGGCRYFCYVGCVIADGLVADTGELYVKHKHLVRTNANLRHTVSAIGELAGNVECCLTAFAEHLEAFLHAGHQLAYND